MTRRPRAGHGGGRHHARTCLTDGTGLRQVGGDLEVVRGCSKLVMWVGRLTPVVCDTRIVAGHRPVYALTEWATAYHPAALGLGPRPDLADFEAPAPSVDGYRVIWVHSSAKAARDAQARAGRIEAGSPRSTRSPTASPARRRASRPRSPPNKPPAPCRRPARPAGSASPSPQPPRSTTGRKSGLDPSRRPATAAPRRPSLPSPPSTPTRCPTTRSPPAASRPHCEVRCIA